jgi:hypothetical protein
VVSDSLDRWHEIPFSRNLFLFLENEEVSTVSDLLKMKVEG